MARLAIFLYGVVVYAIFFPAFLYLFGFMSGLCVPKSVDTGETGPLWLAVLIDTALVLAFAVQHAIMARPGFKRWWTRIIPAPMERSTFVLAATAITILMFWQWRPIPAVIWSVETPALRMAIYGVFFLGIFVALFSSFLIDHFDLFGLRQVILNLRNRPYTQHPFVERSLYKLIRHPLMLGFLITLWAAPTMTVGHALFSALFTAYIFAGTRMEERDLMAAHGSEYAEYRRRTPMLLPIGRHKPASESKQAVKTA